MTDTIDRLILSAPSLLTTETADTPRSWIQLARTGSFVSNRYGNFAITRDDLRQMLHNFREVTPKAPTELPIDYDHLSMDPKRPGDGAAAGWLKQVELRHDGDELWGEVAWTPEAADFIKSGAYRFVSPSFVKDYTYKDGRKIGTTLLAAAITNHPFLEQMAALTLYNFSAMGDLALMTAEETTVQHLAESGQRVSFVDDPKLVPEVSDDERRQTFIVTATVGAGNDQFTRLASLDGHERGWFRAQQLAPARAETTAERPPMEEAPMTSSDQTTLAEQFEQHVVSLTADGRSARDALQAAALEHPAGAEAYRLCGIEAETADDGPTGPVHLSVRDGESFDALCLRYSHEAGVPLRQAVHVVGLAHPALAAAAR
jgi:hypothetical protein